ncbi:leucyl/phenylalanyl-tRNA--protein transferase [Micromonospora peucetia]|uniref:Leucyl/phenylalanyl-tRNA--protein transferase n=1 Tax=Micromonospora peucetia TaxID=47871 RepID=A0A1C6U972_9ACTN|nr:leucyl/phenylalanyl-tRNA--protein transferase [Micromonospora peucetia]MCX4386314.1 leucyl/phenylalanyl-tRNA--protein transferase [Micromonospora peucetia]WSA33656.1 leucyl/phenylalanyl-tRNA--protein transferase [Micromonospora peucetia]SCL50587.1 leucyl/phenylalanyl-tRNA--protein transferase [Micromonospora peucetia]
MGWETLDLIDAPAEGPVAFGDDLSATALLDAYRHGLFPFPADTEERKIVSEFAYESDVAAGRIAVLAGSVDPYAVAWCSPDPRPVIPVDRARIQRSLRRQLRNKVEWTTTLDACFERVVQHCRVDREPRWLTDRLVSTLHELHAAGHAHSVEVWEGDELVGGTFGVRIGGVFSADSQFALRSGAAKVAVACLVRRVADSGGVAVDVQHDGDHAKLIGAVAVPRVEYLALLRKHADDNCAMPADPLPARSLAA